MVTPAAMATTYDILWETDGSPEICSTIYSGDSHYNMVMDIYGNLYLKRWDGDISWFFNLFSEVEKDEKTLEFIHLWYVSILEGVLCGTDIQLQSLEDAILDILKAIVPYGYMGLRYEVYTSMLSVPTIPYTLESLETLDLKPATTPVILHDGLMGIDINGNIRVGDKVCTLFPNDPKDSNTLRLLMVTYRLCHLLDDEDLNRSIKETLQHMPIETVTLV